ncbi:hypothetical protein [Methanoplanus endosymbiosus]|uniref:Uncharacterized protein n=1 Tax=Methanoplanus endosymbiosus TaxID=33865 RepID=A0A9E7PNV0_9EURY|nr:hypothetical protein [Methanoplanus endosymbiosus]UUX92334.1 hypothetical protein L6E24_13495 [Methanoplanus endosymbiosus]
MVEEKTEYFDVLIPPGVPRSVIYDITDRFEVEIVNRKRMMKFANMDGDIRELLAFRCTRDTAEQVQAYMLSELEKFIAE